ncbi:non-ribosomal peptide synthetase [Psychroserpens sp.]
MKQTIVKPNSVVTFNPFQGSAIEKVVHITQSQAEIWISCTIGGENASRAYNESITLILNGALNHAALDDAIQQLIQRHEALRSVFSANGRFMSVLQYEHVETEHKDFSGLSATEQKDAKSDYILEDANYVFDLVNGPLVKIGLLKTDDLQHHLVITAHHIICDGWSLGTILYELGILYSATTSNTVPDLPLAESFSTFADELQDYEGSQEHVQTVQFWLDQYKNNIPQLNLPIDFPRPELRTHKSERLDFPIDNELIAKFKKVGVKSGCSFVTALMSAFEVLLYLQTGQDDVVVGLPSAGQAATGKTHLIGHCVNLLPLRSKIKPDQSFNEYLKDRKLSIFDAYDHQQLSFGELVQELHIQRDPSRVPLVPVVFNIDMGMDSNVDFADLKFKLESNPRTFETFEIFLNASGSEDNFILEWSYNTTLFKSSTIKQMMDTFEELLNTVVANPSIEIGNIIEVDATAYTELNDTTVSYPQLPLHELLAKQVKNNPTKTALKFHNSEITYENLEKQAHQLAHQLAEQGVKPNDCVAVLMPRSIELIITLMAILECGASYLPMDPSYPSKRLEFMLEDSEAKYMITATTSSTLQSTATPLFFEDLFLEISNYPNNPLNLKIDNDKIAYILYTSGSTGKPKGVPVTHKSLVNLLYSFLEKPGMQESDTLISITTISFDIAMAELFAPLLKGARLVLTDEETAKDTRLLLDVMKEESITMMQATPATWQMLLDSGWDEHLPIRVISTGEALPLALAKNILALVNELWNMYGPTETTIWSAYTKIEKTDELIPIGYPMANTQLYIVNEQNKLVAPGKIGELCIAGDGLAKGYWKRPDLTTEKFVNNPFEKDLSATIYRTGDLAKLLPSGKVQCLGRIDHQVKIRGQRIELGEIEEALDSLEGVQSSVVLLNEDRLVANLITSSGIDNQDPNRLDAWKTALKELLPKHMIPQQFNLVKEFPQTLNGKIDRKALLKLLPNIDTTKSVFTAPSTPSEKIIAAIWQNCLGLEKIDVDSDFFEIGGHSIVGVKVMARLEKETGKRLPLVGLLKHPTIKKFAAYMDSEFFTWDSLVPLKPTGTKPPLYIVHGANHQVLIFDALAQYLDKDQPVFGLQSRGLNGVSTPHDSIEEMAADYISEIVASNPDGPYALAGFSYGGIVAYEMARQLKEQGRKVTILAQFDTYVFPQYYYKNSIIKKMISAFYLLGKVGFIILNMFSSKKNFERRSELLGLQLNGWKLRLKHGKAKQYEMQFNVPYKMLKYHNKATGEYTITPQDIVIDLFRATEEVNLVHDHKYLGWKKMAHKGIRKHMVIGNHVDMFEKPDVKDFADKLQHVLDNHNLDHYE